MTEEVGAQTSEDKKWERKFDEGDHFATEKAAVELVLIIEMSDIGSLQPKLN